MRCTRWGVIGAGGIADRRMIPEGILAAENAELVALMDVDEQVRKNLAEKYPKATVYDSVGELVKHPGLDAVYIATPNDLHKEQALAAIGQKKHVLCEKPLAITSADAQEIVDAAKVAGVQVSCDYMMRYNGYHRKVRDLVASGAVGKPVMGRAQLTCWFPNMEGAWRLVKARSGGGAMMDLTSHCVDLLEMILGKTVEVSAFSETIVQDYEEVDDSNLLALKFSSGALGVVDCHFNIPDEASENVLEIYGSKGCIKCKFTIGQGPGGEMVQCLLSEVGGYDAQQQREEEGFQKVEVEGPNTYESVIVSFSRAVQENRASEITGEEAVWNMKVLEGAYESARTGKRVSLIPCAR